MRPRWWICTILIGVVAFGTACGTRAPKPCQAPTHVPDRGPERLDARQRALVLRHAPVILQDTGLSRRRSPRWDFVTAVDFDGNRRGNDNEASLRRTDQPLPAIVYYALVETQTHAFLTYSLFHPMDFGVAETRTFYLWHENDMENLQIVVRKSDDRVVSLATQAHRHTHFYAAPEFGRCQTQWCRRAGPLPLTDTGRAVVYVQSGGHGIYAANDRRHVPRRIRRGEIDNVLQLRPQPGPPDRYTEGRWVYGYALRSTHAEFWRPSRLGTDTGDGALMDGRFRYDGEHVCYDDVPRHFDSDRRSGAGKYDSGILPFAFSHRLHADDLGVLLFDPAKKYPELYEIGDRWSRQYVHNPYLGPLAPRSAASDP